MQKVHFIFKEKHFFLKKKVECIIQVEQQVF